MNIFSIAFVTTVLMIGENNINGQTLRYEPNGITWTDASAQCVNGLEYNATVLQSIKELNGSTLWMGKRVYQKLLPWIEILGCYHVQELVKSYMFQSVGGCQQKCSTTAYFGFKELNGECRCINEKGRLSALSDCMDMDSRNHMLIYQKYDKLSTLDSRNFSILCMTSCCDYTKKIHLSPTDCKVKDRRINGICVYNETLGAETWGEAKSDIIEICRRKQSLLLPSWRCFGNSFQVWSNVFRVLVELELPTVQANGLAPSSSNSCISAYMALESNRLITERRSCNDGLKFFVCKQDTITRTEHYSTINMVNYITNQRYFYSKEFSTTDNPTLKTTKNYSTTSKLQSTDNPTLKTTPDYSTTSKLQSTEKYGSEIFENKSLTTTAIAGKMFSVKHSQSLGAILGSVFGVITLSTVILAVFMVCRKRGLVCFRSKNQTADEEKEEDLPVYDSTTPDHINKRISRDNLGYNLVDISQVNDTITNTPIESTCQKTTEPTYSDSSDGVYDRLNEQSRRKPNISEIEHLYDSSSVARITDDPTYVTANGSRSEKGQNDIYDHSFPNSDSYDEHYG